MWAEGRPITNWSLRQSSWSPKPQSIEAWRSSAINSSMLWPSCWQTVPKRTRDAIFETFLPYAFSRSSISASYVTSINFVERCRSARIRNLFLFKLVWDMKLASSLHRWLCWSESQTRVGLSKSTSRRTWGCKLQCCPRVGSSWWWWCIRLQSIGSNTTRRQLFGVCAPHKIYWKI